MGMTLWMAPTVMAQPLMAGQAMMTSQARQASTKLMAMTAMTQLSVASVMIPSTGVSATMFWLGVLGMMRFTGNLGRIP